MQELFYILDDQKLGTIQIEDLVNELHAGRISEEHEQLIVAKFTEKGKTEVDFIDFLTYILLFLEIHGTIVKNPFDVERNQ